MSGPARADRRVHRLRLGASGQATVEFSLAILLLLIASVGIFDVARAIFDKHGLDRAAETVAHGLVVDYATVPGFNATTSLGDPNGATALAIQAAHTVSDISFSVAAPTLDANTSTYQEISNDPDNSGGSDTDGVAGDDDSQVVYICASPNFSQPQLIQVTISAIFRPVLGLIMGGRAVTLTQSQTALTYLGEEADGTPLSQLNTCPAH